MKLDLQNQLTSVQEKAGELKPQDESSSKDRPTSRLITEVHTSEENTKRDPVQDDLVTTAQAMDIQEMTIDVRQKSEDSVDRANNSQASILTNDAWEVQMQPKIEENDLQLSEGH